jgi:DNA-binding transcriptional MocR family regulator
MTIWNPDLSTGKGPKYRVLTDAIASAIKDGTLKPGARLPAQRELAWALELSVGTVTRAYADAERRELVTGEVGRGTWVRQDSGLAPTASLWTSARDNHGPVNLVMNLPPVGLAAEALEQTLGDLTAKANVSSLGALLDYQSTGCIDNHLVSAAAWLGRVGLEATAENMVLTNGAQHGILMALMAVTHPGDTILAEALSYPPLKQMAHHFGLKLQALEMDGDGIVPDAMEAACRKSGAKALYCMPTLQSPTGATMPEDRRQQIADIAIRHDLVIIEDDVFGFLPERRPLPLATYAPDNTLFVTSVSKSLAPGLRVGMVRVPARYIDAVRNAVQMSCWMPSPLLTEIVHRWIDDGTADELNLWLRQQSKTRRDVAQNILGAAMPDMPYLSTHCWVGIPQTWSPDDFRAAAEQREVRVAIGDMFRLKSGPPVQALRLALGYETDIDRLTKGLEVVASLLGTDGNRATTII